MFTFDRPRMLLILMLGGMTGCCRLDPAERDPIYTAPAVTDDLLAKVLAEPERVPQRDPAPPHLGNVLEGLADRLGQALETAAAAGQASDRREQAIRIQLWTADWCTYCRPARERTVPWLQSQGYIVEIVDVTRNARSTPRVLPTWVFLRDGRELYRQEGGYTPQQLETAIQRVGVSTSPVVGGFTGPTLRLSDALPLIAGLNLNLGSAASITVPKDLTWTISSKPGSVSLAFHPMPQVTLQKWLTWHVRLEGVEITPTGVTLQIDHLPDITVKFDWSPPAATNSPPIEPHKNRHTAGSHRHSRERPMLHCIGQTVLFASRLTAIASFVLMLV